MDHLSNPLFLLENDFSLQINHLLAANNLLSRVPDIVSNLSNLTRLDFSNNSINLVCDAITSLMSLTHLYLRNNEITDNDLPKDMIGLRNLHTLNLSGNHLTRFPAQLLDISSMRNLFLVPTTSMRSQAASTGLED